MRILLACNAGMSTSMIVSKMEEIVQKNGENHIIWAVDIESIDDDIGEFDVLLLGPQVIIRKQQHRQSHKVHHLYHQLHH